MTTTVLTPPPASSMPTKRRYRTSRRVGVSSIGPLILSASVAIALARLAAHDLSFRVLAPLVASIVVADVVTAVAMRLRINVVLAVAVGWAISLGSLLVIVDPSVFDPGSSHFLHASVVSGQWRAARAALANDGTPLPSLSGIVMILGAIGAAASSLTRGIWARQRRRPFVDQGRGPLSPCLAPSVAIFLYSTLVSAEHTRVAAFVCYVLGVLVFIALADRTTSPVTPPGAPAGLWGHRTRWGAGAVTSCLLVALVVTAAGVGLSGMRLTVFHVTPPPPVSPARHGQGVPQQLITGSSLVDHLLATEISESDAVVFHATSPVTTYWQVGTLSSFNGTEWLPRAEVSDALAGSTGALKAALSSTALPSPAPAQAFTARVTITDFTSRLLPAPPGTLDVRGLPGASAIAEEGVLASSADITGTSYTVTAPLDAALPSGGSQLPSSDPRLAPYLALPAQPAVVAELAHQAVGNAVTPAARAQALVNWFRSGRFRYTLSPPPTTGSDPLVQFLTVTKAGFCEQFAGAYGVLARSLGIPTRLVVGFTAGQPGPDGTFTVTGADAHVWPQVYLGPDAGWVSVEPTPPSVAGSPAAEGVVGAAGATGSRATASPSTTVVGHTSTPASSPGAAGSPRDHRPRPRPHHTPASGSGFPWWVVGAVAVGLLLLGSIAVWAWRRRRASIEAALLPDARVVRAWERALVALRRQGLPRRPDETPAEYAVRVRVAQGTTSPAVEADAMGHLAGLVELACYTPRPCTPAQATHAHALASTIVTANRSHRRRRARHQPEPKG
jgi:transglutaminase-like putative cysteine protease